MSPFLVLTARYIHQRFHFAIQMAFSTVGRHSLVGSIIKCVDSHHSVRYSVWTRMAQRRLSRWLDLIRSAWLCRNHVMIRVYALSVLDSWLGWTLGLVLFCYSWVSYCYILGASLLYCGLDMGHLFIGWIWATIDGMDMGHLCMGWIWDTYGLQ